MRLWWVSMSLFIEWEGELGVVIFSCSTSSTSSSSWKRDMVDSLVRSISTSIQLLSMEAVFSMSKWSEEKVSRKPPCPRNCVSMVGCVIVVLVVYLLLGQGRE